MVYVLNVPGNHIKWYSIISVNLLKGYRFLKNASTIVIIEKGIVTRVNPIVCIACMSSKSCNDANVLCYCENTGFNHRMVFGCLKTYILILFLVSG